MKYLVVLALFLLAPFSAEAAISIRSVGNSPWSDNTANPSEVAVPNGAGAAAGDVLIACIAAKGSGAPTLIKPSNFTVLGNSSSGTMNIWTLYADATVTSASYLFRFENVTGFAMRGTIVVVSGADSSSIVNVMNAADQGSWNGAKSFTGLTPTRANNALVMCGGGGQAVSFPVK